MYKRLSLIHKNFVTKINSANTRILNCNINSTYILVDLFRNNPEGILKMDYVNSTPSYKYSALYAFCSILYDKRSMNNPSKIECKRCKYVWLTKSSNPYYVCCSRCKTSIVRKNIVQVDSLVGASNQPEQTERGDLS